MKYKWKRVSLSNITHVSVVEHPHQVEPAKERMLNAGGRSKFLDISATFVPRLTATFNTPTYVGLFKDQWYSNLLINSCSSDSTQLSSIFSSGTWVLMSTTSWLKPPTPNQQTVNQKTLLYSFKI